MYNCVVRFEWDTNKAIENEGKHGVSFEEAEEVFDDPSAVNIFDADHSIAEDRYYLIGFSSRRLLTVVYVEKQAGVYRIISAWKSRESERDVYEKG